MLVEVRDRVSSLTAAARDAAAPPSSSTSATTGGPLVADRAGRVGQVAPQLGVSSSAAPAPRPGTVASRRERGVHPVDTVRASLRPGHRLVARRAPAPRRGASCVRRRCWRDEHARRRASGTSESPATSTSAPVARTCAGLVRAHGHRRLGVLHRERASEPAALLGPRQRAPGRARAPPSAAATACRRPAACAASGRWGGRSPGAGKYAPTSSTPSTSTRNSAELRGAGRDRRRPAGQPAARARPGGHERVLVPHRKATHDPDGAMIASYPSNAATNDAHQAAPPRRGTRC